MKKIIILIAFCFLIIACASLKKNRTSPTPTFPLAILVDDFSEYSRESSDTQIINAAVKDSTLTLNVSYSGGCKDHDFQLIGAKMIQKSFPPIRGIMLVHNSNSDNCRELIERELNFNISNFKYPNGDIMLKLTNYKPKVRFSSID
jgi:hypothetical protein